MSAKSFSKITLYAAGLTLWVVTAFVVGQTLAALIMSGIGQGLNDSVEMTIMAALGYILALGITLGVPVALFRIKVSKAVLGISRLPSWTDIGLSILAVLPYYIVSGMLVYVGIEVLQVIDPEVGQDIPFKNLSVRIEYIVAFITLVVMAPLAEELMFRGYFLGRLQEKTGKWAAVLVTAVLFGLMHVIGVSEGGGVVLQWGAAVDTFAMGLIAGGLRVVSGSIWAGVLLHSIKNGIAFYFLFINPLPPA
jgi:membrane protease YdiL (CAAX protease family)